jgi:hypothetical protein
MCTHTHAERERERYAAARCRCCRCCMSAALYPSLICFHVERRDFLSRRDFTAQLPPAGDTSSRRFFTPGEIQEGHNHNLQGKKTGCPRALAEAERGLSIVCVRRLGRLEPMGRSAGRILRCCHEGDSLLHMFSLLHTCDGWGG